MVANIKRMSGQPGVRWDEKAQRWQCYLSRGEKNIHLGLFEEADLDRAIALRREAETVADEDIPALRMRYGLRVRGMAPAPAPAPDATMQLYLAALKADEKLAEANREAAVATNTAHRAEEASRLAWNALAKALAEVGRNVDSGFIRSQLGCLLEEE